MLTKTKPGHGVFMIHITEILKEPTFNTVSIMMIFFKKPFKIPKMLKSFCINSSFSLKTLCLPLVTDKTSTQKSTTSSLSTKRIFIS